MLPRLHETVTIAQGTGLVIETFAHCVIVRIYDKYDVTIYPCDEWEYSK